MKRNRRFLVYLGLGIVAAIYQWHTGAPFTALVLLLLIAAFIPFVILAWKRDRLLAARLTEADRKSVDRMVARVAKHATTLAFFLWCPLFLYYAYARILRGGGNAFVENETTTLIVILAASLISATIIAVVFRRRLAHISKFVTSRLHE